MIKHNVGQTIVVIIDYCNYHAALTRYSTHAGEQRVQVMSGDPRTGYHTVHIIQRA
jgi:hypothetical protein